MRKKIIAVIGGSNASEENLRTAEKLGALIAKAGYILVTGGLSGVMESASKGAKQAGGLIVGIIPYGSPDRANAYVDIAIATNMGHARNAIIAHTADALISVDGEEGTLSEIAFGLKLGKIVIGINSWKIKGMTEVTSPEEAIDIIRTSH